MDQVIWMVATVIILALAVGDFVLLWRWGRASHSTPSEKSSTPPSWFRDFSVQFISSPYCLATQGTMAIFAAIYTADRAFDAFPVTIAVQNCMLLFMVLMTVGMVRILKTKSVPPQG